MNKFKDIVGRAEQIRLQLGLNKSQFSIRIGMKPQTYNNFVGSQGSKPNVELILGIVQTFNVDPRWLLNGSGEPFPDTARARPLAEAPLEPGTATDRSRGSHRAKLISALRGELDLILAPWRANDTPLLHTTAYRNTHVAYAVAVMTHFFWVSPAETAAQVMDMLADFGRIAGEMERVSRHRSQLD